MSLCQQLQLSVFLDRSLQALHTWIWAVYLILPGRSSQTQVDLIGSVCELQFSGLPTDVLLGFNMGFGWATQGQSETFPTCFGCMLWVIVMLKGESSSQSQVTSVWSSFSSRTLLYPAASILPSILTSLPIHATEKNSPSAMLTPSWFTGGMALAR